ncbi:DNA polymerase III subunit alpha [Isoptericola croceus]|uniref:DNA polymerase III subunit alpha n=1 Tax=Isoptericola croceus TaxID=3031406 RepID=UPI0023F976D4|nr:DNA polymerase III subunit alpha [Isoptericola croceus]
MGTMTGGYVSLHTHSDYSALDGLASVGDYVAAAARDGQPALAITDHGTLAGAWQLTEAAQAAGIKPIVGLEAYLAFGDRHQRGTGPVDPDDGDNETARDTRKAKRDKSYMHLTLLAATETGWANLVRIANAATESFWTKPRIDYDLVAEHAEGIIVLTGCLGGPLAYYLNRAVLSERRAERLHHEGKASEASAESRAAAELRATARDQLAQIIAAVGRENVYVEVMDHGIEAQHRVTDSLRELAAEFDVPLVATNDAHYLSVDDERTHAAWLANSSGKTLEDPKRFAFHGHGHHFRTEEEMRALFDGAQWWQEAVDNTVKIAERCAERTLPAPRVRMPSFPTPDGFADSTAYLKHLVSVGAVRRYSDESATSTKDLPDEVRARLRYEFEVIKSSGFGDYFLIVADVISWARDQGILVGPGRGSAAGSLVAYALGITNIDPLRHNLLFERFLDPQRAGLPDIDVDFAKSRRTEVLRYFATRWDWHNVAQLGSFGVKRTKAVIRDAARVLGFEQSMANALCKKVAMKGAKPYPLTRVDDPDDPATEAFRRQVAGDPERAVQVLELARGMENRIASASTHPCGVVLSDEPLDALVPMRRDNGAVLDAPRITEWDGPDVEAFGLVKMDFLVLRNLDIAAEAVRMVEANTGENVDVDALDPDRPDRPERAAAVWTMLQSGRTAGVFQLDSSGMTKLCEQVAPGTIDDLSALVALFRPGPLGQGMHTRYADRKNGREEVSYDYLTTDPGEQAAIASVLGSTYGTVLYQEQLMLLGSVVAGFGASEKNRLRKAVAKKKAAELAELAQLWFDGGMRPTVDDDGHEISPAFSRATLERLWATFEASGEYLFNKSHSAAYGQVAYVTAYLKANWPAEYGAAVLACTDGKVKRAASLVDLEAEGLTVLAPDVNRAAVTTSTDGTDILLGLAEIAGVGKNAATIVAERDRAGVFTSLADFVVRMRASAEPLPVSVVEALIGAGALDAFGPRLGMMMSVRAISGDLDMAPPVLDAEWGVVERSARQRELLGCVLGTHPLVALRDQVRAWRPPMPQGANATTRRTVHPLHKITGDGAALTLGVLADWTERSYARGRMATARLEGSRSTMELVAFDDELRRITESWGASPQPGDLVGVSGQVNTREREVTSVDESGAERTETQTTTSLVVRHLWPVEVDDDAHVEVPPATARPALRVIDGALGQDARETADSAEPVSPTRADGAPPWDDEPAVGPEPGDADSTPYDDAYAYDGPQILPDASDDFGDGAPAARSAKPVDRSPAARGAHEWVPVLVLRAGALLWSEAREASGAPVREVLTALRGVRPPESYGSWVRVLDGVGAVVVRSGTDHLGPADEYEMAAARDAIASSQRAWVQVSSPVVKTEARRPASRRRISGDAAA